MIGGFAQVGVEARHNEMVAANIAKINQKVGVQATSYNVNKVFSQVVAGTNFFYHLTSDTGEKVSVCLFEALPHLNVPIDVSLAVKGHVEATNPGSIL